MRMMRPARGGWAGVACIVSVLLRFLSQMDGSMASLLVVELQSSAWRLYIGERAAE